MFLSFLLLNSLVMESVMNTLFLRARSLLKFHNLFGMLINLGFVLTCCHVEFIEFVCHLFLPPCVYLFRTRSSLLIVLVYRLIYFWTPLSVERLVHISSSLCDSIILHETHFLFWLVVDEKGILKQIHRFVRIVTIAPLIRHQLTILWLR